MNQKLICPNCFNIVEAVRGLYQDPEIKIRRRAWPDDVFLCLLDPMNPPIKINNKKECNIYVPVRDDYLYLDWEGSSFEKCSDNNLYRAMMRLYATGDAIRRSSWSPWSYVNTMSIFDEAPTFHFWLAGVAHQLVYLPSKADYFDTNWEVYNGQE